MERTSPIILVTSEDFKKKYLEFCKTIQASPSDVFETLMKQAIDNLNNFKVDFSNIRKQNQ